MDLQQKYQTSPENLKQKEPSPTKIIQKASVILYISGRLYFLDYKSDLLFVNEIIYNKFPSQQCFI